MNAQTPEIPTEIKDEHPGRYWLRVANETNDPISMCGAALCGLLELLTVRDEADQKAEADSALAHARDDDALVDEINAALEKLDTIRAVVGKSTAVWADKIREALGDVPKGGASE